MHYVAEAATKLVIDGTRRSYPAKLCGLSGLTEGTIAELARSGAAVHQFKLEAAFGQ